MSGYRAGLLALTLALAGCQAGPPDGTPAAAEGRPEAAADILFTRRAGRSNSLHVRSADGSTVDLTPDTEGDNWGVWSPDGSAIAFQARRDGNTEVYVMDADGGNPRNLSNNPAHDGLPVWSPDGERIAFFSSRGMEQNDRGLPGHIYVVGVDGDRRGLRQLTLEPLTSTLGPSAWSPDGRFIYFVRQGDDVGGKVVRLDVETGTEEILFESTASLGGGTLSPNGGSLVMYVDEGDRSRLAVLRLDEDDELEFVGPADGYQYYPRWSPDGRRIIYTVLGDDGTLSVHGVDVSSGATEALLGTEPNALEASWRPGAR